MAEPDLTAAIEAGRAASRAEAAKMFGCEPGDLAVGVADILDAAAIRAAAPLIERAVREQAAQQLITWADTFAGGNATQRRMCRHIHMCAQRIGPKMTDLEVAEALARGDYVACHLDDAGRAIPPGERT